MIEWEVVSQETAWQTVRILVLKRQQETWSRTDFLGVPGGQQRPSVHLPPSGGKVHEELAVPGPLLGAADSADRASSCTNQARAVEWSSWA